MYPIVNGRTCTTCKDAYMGAFKTAWALGFIPQRGFTYSIETYNVVKFVVVFIPCVVEFCRLSNHDDTGMLC